MLTRRLANSIALAFAVLAASSLLWALITEPVLTLACDVGPVFALVAIIGLVHAARRGLAAYRRHRDWPRARVL